MAARVAAALSELMGGHPFFQIIGPAAVKAAVSAFEQVDIARGSRARRGSSLRARRAFVGAWGHTARFLSVILCHDGIRNPFVRIRISYKKIQGLSITRRMHDSRLGSPIFCLGALGHFPSAHARLSLRRMRDFHPGPPVFLPRRAWTFPFFACAIFIPDCPYFCLGALASRRPCRKRSKNSTSKMRRGTGNRPHFLVE